MNNDIESICCELEITEVTLLPAADAAFAKKCDGRGAENIWYCLGEAGTVVLVNASGNTFQWPTGCEYLWSGVRPAIKFSNMEESGLNKQDRFRIAGHTFTVVSEGTALCDELIFHKTITLAEVQAAMLPGYPDPEPGTEEKVELIKKFPEDNPCTLAGINNILTQWIEKNNIKVAPSDNRNTVEIVKK